KVGEHFLWIAAAMNRVGGRHDRLWDETDGFFYDQLRLPDGRAVRLKVRSLVGLLPLCAATVIEADLIARFPSVVERVERFLAHHPELVQAVAPLDRPGVAGRRMLALLDEAKRRRALARLPDEEGCLSPFGLRAVPRGPSDEPVRGERRDRAASGEPLRAGRARPPAGVRRRRKAPNRPSLPRPPPVLRVLPRGQRRGHRGEPPDRMDWARGPAAPA